MNLIGLNHSLRSNMDSDRKNFVSDYRLNLPKGILTILKRIYLELFS